MRREMKARVTFVALEPTGSFVETCLMEFGSSDPDEMIDEIFDSDEYLAFDRIHEGRISTTIEWLDQGVTAIHQP